MFNTLTSDTFGKTLSQLWLFAILNVLFRDIHEYAIAGTIEEVLTGHVNGTPITEELMLAAGFAVIILLLAMLLSYVLTPIWVRRVNLVAPVLAILGMTGAPPADPDDYLFAAVEVATFALIFVLAWRWKPVPEKNVRTALHDYERLKSDPYTAGA